MRKKKSFPKTLDDLTPAPYNPRQIGHQAGSALSFSMKEFGDLSGFVFNVRTGHLVSGHQRRDRLPAGAAIIDVIQLKDDCGTVAIGHIKDGMRLWPVRFVNWNLIKEKAANLTANNREISGEVTTNTMGMLSEVRKELPDVFDQSMLFKIEDQVASLRRRNSDGDIGEPEAEYDLSLQPYESYNYVVLIFKNDIDWTAARDHFRLKKVREPAGGSKAIGEGKVVDGANYLSRLLKK